MMYAYGLLNRASPRDVPAWLWLTGWLCEDLGPNPRGGAPSFCAPSFFAAAAAAVLCSRFRLRKSSENYYILR